MMNRFGRNFRGTGSAGGDAEGGVDHLGEGAPLAEDEALGGAKAKFARASGSALSRVR
jgi:hypothetical protein